MFTTFHYLAGAGTKITDTHTDTQLTVMLATEVTLVGYLANKRSLARLPHENRLQERGEIFF